MPCIERVCSPAFHVMVRSSEPSICAGRLQPGEARGASLRGIGGDLHLLREREHVRIAPDTHHHARIDRGRSAPVAHAREAIARTRTQEASPGRLT
jgi:hypothetical protein